ncbi:hypothetical protein [Rhodococcus sp. H29-C3]|nr:hypothetical protein [Rhodococcus sp. H29-C3]MDJ0359698.1 hypothetical protein [Rhodococcus sp. H29-C3]
MAPTQTQSRLTRLENYRLALEQHLATLSDPQFEELLGRVRTTGTA